MDFLTGGVSAASPAIAVFIRDHGAALPAVTFDTLAAFTPSPVDRIVNAAEALYAAADGLGPEGLTLCAQLARICEEHGFHVDPDDPGRWGGFVAAMRRRVGETTIPDPSEDPAPRAGLVPATE